MEETCLSGTRKAQWRRGHLSWAVEMEEEGILGRESHTSRGGEAGKCRMFGIRESCSWLQRGAMWSMRAGRWHNSDTVKRVCGRACTPKGGIRT